ncbi:hypothetical protein NEOKW01_0894 [Nematocida sp. AWRm80]|nr:hypothetical protein NEOKW01_0894 [Nematocida sp. AWRm80]
MLQNIPQLNRKPTIIEEILIQIQKALVRPIFIEPFPKDNKQSIAIYNVKIATFILYVILSLWITIYCIYLSYRYLLNILLKCSKLYGISLINTFNTVFVILIISKHIVSVINSVYYCVSNGIYVCSPTNIKSKLSKTFSPIVHMIFIVLFIGMLYMRNSICAALFPNGISCISNMLIDSMVIVVFNVVFLIESINTYRCSVITPVDKLLLVLVLFSNMFLVIGTFMYSEYIQDSLLKKFKTIHMNITNGIS